MYPDLLKNKILFNNFTMRTLWDNVYLVLAGAPVTRQWKRLAGQELMCSDAVLSQSLSCSTTI